MVDDRDILLESTFKDQFHSAAFSDSVECIFVPADMVNQDKPSSAQYANSIQYYYNTTNQKTIIFCSSSEGLDGSYIRKMNEIVKLLIDVHGISIEHTGYITGATPTYHNVNMYRIHREKHNWLPIPLYFLNVCELMAAGRINTDPVSYSTIDTTPRIKSKKLLCFNRMSKPHRSYIVSELIKRNLLHKSYVSMYFYDHNTTMYLPSLGEGVDQVLKNNENILPLTLSLDSDHENAHQIVGDITYFNDSYFSLITETNYFKNYGQLDGHFLTEKTFKAISGKHPFILVGRPGLVESLRTLGYKSFAPHINESYDWIEDDELRLEAIMNEVERLCNFTDIEWMDFQTNVQSIVEHNFNLIANTGRNHPPKLTKA